METMIDVATTEIICESAPSLAKMPHQLRPYAFDSVKAALAGKKSAELRKQAKETAKPIALVAPEQPQNALQLRVQQIEKQIQQTIDAFGKTKDPREMQALAMAQDRLFQTWALLTGHERPGVRRARKAQSQPDPILLFTPDE